MAIMPCRLAEAFADCVCDTLSILMRSRGHNVGVAYVIPSGTYEMNLVTTCKQLTLLKRCCCLFFFLKEKSDRCMH